MFLPLMLWRSVFAALHRRPLLKENAAPHRHYDNAVEQRFLILERACAGVIAENGLDAVPDGVWLSDGRSRAKTYLRRVAALTGATQADNRYVGKTRFYVRDRCVGRLRDSTNPECGYEETCFYSVHKGMPREEEIATVLLQLKSNPALFDKWIIQNGLAFKADGQVFTGAQ
jgi:hypothetical protein